jgi:hypothetical protein
VNGASGTTDQFMRGYGIADSSAVLNFGAFKGNGILDAQGPLVGLPFHRTAACRAH